MDTRYKIQKQLALGGMGEIFLAFDKEAKRFVALKKIKQDLEEKPLIIKRFIREAKITSILSHPSIIPIYDICFQKPYYYTMPYIEGKTLKDILNEAANNQKNETYTLGNLIRIFLNVCSAISYMHSKNILHRDIKPDNIIIGNFDQVMLIDLGIAKFLNEKQIDDYLELKNEDIEVTQPGKAAGTLSYMPPERILNHLSYFESDIYSLGAILYKILTLEVPSIRKDLKTFKKMLKHEVIIPPIEKAPFRDIPQKLADIAMKCLEKDLKNRYSSVDDLIKEIKDYIDGTPEWVLSADLDINKKSDWQFQENITLSKNIAISKNEDIFEWITLMVSKKSFFTNVTITADISMDEFSNGLGFFLNILKDTSSYKIDEGYRLWINVNEKESHLYHSNVIIESSKIDIKPDVFKNIKIQKVDDKLSIFLDNVLIFSHESHLFLKGGYFGFAYKDTNFLIKNLKIYTSSYNVMVNCLAIGDAFFIKQDFDSAIEEYKKIAFSFPRRQEASEAHFRCATAYLEKAKKTKLKKKQYFDLSLLEFEKLHQTPSKPYEYLGKSLVYAEMKDFIEEAKCLELMIRKHKDHQSKETLNAHIIHRMHQCSVKDKTQAYRIVLIALRFITDLLKNRDTKNLLTSLDKNLEKLYFYDNSKDLVNSLIIKLGFILNKPELILESLESLTEECLIKMSIFALLELDKTKLAINFLEEKNSFEFLKPFKNLFFEALKILSSKNESSLLNFINEFSKSPSNDSARILIFLFEKLLDEKKSALIIKSFEKIHKLDISKEYQVHLDNIYIRACFLEKKFLKNIGDIFSKYKIEKINKDNHPLHFLYGLWLYTSENTEIYKTYFSYVLDIYHPSSYALSSHYLKYRKKSILKNAFYFEKKRLQRDIFIHRKVVS
ncbi:MAG: protein kinase [Parachlamydiales bacterium]|nr:protein kinase [Parachlamydiales bacterium]